QRPLRGRDVSPGDGDDHDPRRGRLPLAPRRHSQEATQDHPPHLLAPAGGRENNDMRPLRTRHTPRHLHHRRHRGTSPGPPRTTPLAERLHRHPEPSHHPPTEETMTDQTPYLRLQANYIGRLGVEVGIFVAVDHLRRKNLLTPEEEDLYFDLDDWFREHLPEPPFYADGNTLGAITWFKQATTAAMLTRLTPLRDLLSVHDVRCDLVRSDRKSVV